MAERLNESSCHEVRYYLMNRKRNSEKGVREWFRSYVLVLIAPTLMFVCLYLYSFLANWEEVQNMYNSSFRVAAKQLDDVFEKGILLEYSIMTNNSLSEVAKLKDISTTAEREKLFIAMNGCANIGAVYNDISSYVVFFPSISTAISPGTYVRVLENNADLGLMYNWGEWDWNTKLYERAEQEFFVNGKDDSIRYVSSLPKFGNKWNMNLVVEFNTARIKDILSYSDAIEGGGFIILDTKGTMLLSYNIQESSEQTNWLVENSIGYKIKKIGNTWMFVSGIESQSVNLKYISVIPVSFFWNTTFKTVFLLLSTLFCSVIIGVFISWFLAKIKYKTYSPLWSLLTPDDQKALYDMRGYKEVSIAINRVVTEYKEMRRLLKEAEKQKREVLLTDILMGRIRPENVKSILEKNGFILEEGSFSLIIFRQMQFNSVYDKRTPDMLKEDVRLYGIVLLKLIEELDKRKITRDILSIDEKTVCLINFGEHHKEECEHIIQDLVKILCEYESSCGLSFTITIGDVHGQTDSILGAYLEILRALEYQLSLKKSFIMYQSEMMLEGIDFLFTAEQEKELLAVLHAGESEQALVKLEELYKKSMVEFRLESGVKQCFDWDLAACILKTESKSGISDHSWLDEFAIKIKQERLDILKERVLLICKQINREKNKKCTLICDVKEYVQNHFDDLNLNNSTIAQYFNKNASYLSDRFKVDEGITLLEYVHQIRLIKAKELLRKTNLSVEEIANMVGLANGRNLIRLFNKYEFMSPTTYRKNAKLREDIN